MSEARNYQRVGSPDNSLPPGWCWTTISDVANLITKGSSPGWQGFQYQASGVKFVRSQNVRWGFLDLTEIAFLPDDFNQSHRNSIIRHGDVLLNLVGASVGRVAIATLEIDGANLNQAIAIIRLLPSSLTNKLLMYFMLSPQIQAHISATKADVARANFNLDDVRPTRIPLPPLNEQHRIVAKIEELFSDLDAGVAALVRIKANLKRYRAAVLKAAVEGRLTEEWRARHPKTEPATKLLERILAERRQKWEEDQLAKFAAADKTPPKGWREKYVEPAGPETNGLPELPQGWCWATVEQVTNPTRTISYGILKPGPYIADGVPMIRIVDLRNGKVDLSNVHRVSVDLSEEYNRTRLVGGEVLLSLVGTVGVTAYYSSTIGTANLHRNVGMIVPMGIVEPKFVTSVFQSEWVQRQIRRATTGALQPLFNLADVRRIVVPVAPSNEQVEIVLLVEERMACIDRLTNQIEANLKRAARLRQSILKRAFEGKLVPQDPTEEPADKLLESIRQERTATNGSVPQRARRGRTKSRQPEGGTHGAAS